MGILKTAIKGVDAFPDIHRVNEGWRALTGTGLRVDNDDYENVYGSASKIINRVADVLPYAIDVKGDRIVEARAVDKTYKPNQQMSGYDFREALFGKFIILGEALILVHTVENGEVRAGGNITPDNIAGYTFLENAVRMISPIDGKITYTVNGKTFTDDEVIRIHGFNPNSLVDKYSPTQAARRWSGIDDYIADYQRGFFKNGAVPAGEFVITAPTTQEFRDMKDRMQQMHRGAGRNNNVMYVHRPTDATGKPLNAQIEWTPYANDNKSLDLGAIFEQVNAKIDSAFGVPASIRGVGENNNYATAQMDARNFVENTINPLLLKVWTGFMHELNRITGGLGYAITYDLDIPSVSDDEKVQAETHKVTFDTIALALEQGFTIESILESIEAPESYQSLIKGYVKPVAQDDADVDMGDEVEDSPDQAVTKAVEMIVSRIEAHNDRKLLSDISNLVGAAKSTDPKALKALTPIERLVYEEQLEVPARKLMQKQVDRAITDTKAVGDPTEDEIKAFADEMLKAITGILVVQGAVSYAEGVGILVANGISTSGTSNFTVSEDQLQRYRKYLLNVGDSYSHDTRLAIQSVLDTAMVNQLPRAELEKNLQNIMNTNEWRVKRIGVTETNRAGGNASLFSMEQIQEEAQVQVNKVWRTSRSDACQYCKALEGTSLPVRDSFLPVGDAVIGVDGGIMVNDFVSMEIANGHPNCNCYLSYEVIR